jgi:uncharacterized RDD family membrane protein YckC
MSLQIETAQNVGVDYEVASVGDRILAQLIDYAVYLVWILSVIGIIFAVNLNRYTVSPTWVITGGIMLPILLYSLLCEYFLEGQTLGKMAMKIKVIKLDGSKATLSAYLLRWLLSIIDITIFSGVVAILTVIINGKGQRLGDIAAGTTVIKMQPAIRLEHILPPELDMHYQPKYPGAAQLSDRDIRTIRKVLATNNEELIEKTMYKVESLIGVHSLDTGSIFLQEIVNDYHFYTSAEV